MPDMPEALVRAAAAVEFPSARIVFYYVAMFGTVGVLGPFLPVWLEDRAPSAPEIALVRGALSRSRVAVHPDAAHVADVTGRRKRLAMLAAAGACLGFALLSESYGFWAILAALVLTAACQGPVLPVGENLCLLTIRARGLEYGRLRAWGSVAFIVVVLSAGYYLDGAPKAHIVYLLLAGWTVIFLAVVCLPDLRSPPRVAHERGLKAGPAVSLLREPNFR
ncbi:MAG: MFS transporter, partial [Alphaproteobacteria bacterium]